MEPVPNSPAIIIGDATLAEPPPGSNQQTASLAKAILCESAPSFRDPTATQRSAIAAAFAAKNFVVYGKAFDVVELTHPNADLDDQDIIADAIDRRAIALIEVKSTARDLNEDFGGHFFSMSTAELLVAQSLGSLFKFAFVNTRSRYLTLVTLQDIFRRAKAIYPTWSIRFDDRPFEQR